MAHEHSREKRHIAYCETVIYHFNDRLVYQLYDLTEEEIKIIESN